jgi:hypothetical protein
MKQILAAYCFEICKKGNRGGTQYRKNHNQQKDAKNPWMRKKPAAYRPDQQENDKTSSHADKNNTTLEEAFCQQNAAFDEGSQSFQNEHVCFSQSVYDFPQ